MCYRMESCFENNFFTYCSFIGIPTPMVKEEIFPEIDLFSCMDGFSLILSSNGDVIYVSDNVSRYIGLTQVQLAP